MYARVKPEHDLVGIELLPIPFEEFYQFFNQLALDKKTGHLLLSVSTTTSVIKSLYIAHLFHCMYL